MGLTVAGIGELLWDVFPEHRRLGGAPVNFACHCRQLGARGIPVSCIGADTLGDEILREVAALGVETDYLQRSVEAPTGTVQVALDSKGVPSYTIGEDVAWDAIRLDDALRELAPRLDAVCFGSLGQRAPVSRETIRTFLSLCRPDAIRIFDVNLRQSFYSQFVIEQSLRAATVFKVSDEELPRVMQLLELQGEPTEALRRVIARYELDLAAYTLGSKGALLVTADRAIAVPGCDAVVVDTVGAGDAFTAALCMGLLNHAPLEAIGKHANAVAAFVCTQKGATPPLPDKLVCVTK